MPRFGQRYAFPEDSVPTYLGHPARVFLTDTPPLGLAPSSPETGAKLHWVNLWLRAAVSWEQPQHSVILVVDATAPAIWEDRTFRNDITKTLVALRLGGFLVSVAVTKLLKAREAALRSAAYGIDRGGQAGKDPHTSYETFAERYISKLVVAFEASARENGWRWGDPPGFPPFPQAHVTVLDVPTWTSAGDFKAWQERRGTMERPNQRYIFVQLEKLLQAALPPRRDEA